MYKSNEYTVQKELFLSWGQTPLMEHLSEKLQELVPFEGEVEDKKNNPALEKFRKATNVVYDIFNNGLINRQWQVFGVLGLRKRDLPLPSYHRGYHYPGNWDRVEEMVHKQFKPIVLAAAKEQGLI